MAFGDHLIGVHNAQSTFINTQEGYARLEKEAKAQNKELVFVGNFNVKIVPKRNFFEKITDFLKGEVRAEKRALRDFKVSLPNIKQNALNIKEAKEGIGGGADAEIEIKTRRAANTFKNTYAKQSESVSRGEIRSTIRDRHDSSRADRTHNGILRRDGISESATIIKTQLKQDYNLKPKDFNLDKPLASIGEESEEEISENVGGNRDALRTSLKSALDDIASQTGDEYSDIQLSEEQRENIKSIAKDLDDSEVDLEQAYAALSQNGISFEGSLAPFAKTKDQLIELRGTTGPIRAQAPVSPTTSSASERAQELSTNIKNQLSILLQVLPSTFPDAPADQLAQASQVNNELFSEKYNNPDETLKLDVLEPALYKAGITLEVGLFADVGDLIRELKAQQGV